MAMRVPSSCLQVQDARLGQTTLRVVDLEELLRVVTAAEVEEAVFVGTFDGAVHKDAASLDDVQVVEVADVEALDRSAEARVLVREFSDPAHHATPRDTRHGRADAVAVEEEVRLVEDLD